MQRLAPEGALGNGCARACASGLGAALLLDWPGPQITLPRKPRKTERLKVEIFAAHKRCDRRTIELNLSLEKKHFTLCLGARAARYASVWNAA